MADNKSTSLGKWLEDLFEKVFYQPDDEVWQKAIDESISPALKVTINGNSMPGEVFLKLAKDSRRTHRSAVKHNRELLAAGEPTDTEVGSVAHLQTFTMEDKTTGAVREVESVTICTIAFAGGKKQLVELAEVTSY